MEKRIKTEFLVTPRLLDAEELSVYLSLGKNLATNTAREAKCVMKIGRRTLFDRKKLDAWLDGQTRDECPKGW